MVLGHEDFGVEHAWEELEGEAAHGRDDADHFLGSEHVLDWCGEGALGQVVETQRHVVDVPLVFGTLHCDHDGLVEDMVVAVVQAPGTQSCPGVDDVVRD